LQNRFRSSKPEAPTISPTMCSSAIVALSSQRCSFAYNFSVGRKKTLPIRSSLKQGGVVRDVVRDRRRASRSQDTLDE
jgi:hypothetical protein